MPWLSPRPLNMATGSCGVRHAAGRGAFQSVCLCMTPRAGKHEVSAALKDTIEFLTGDYWSISFVRRRGKVPSPPQDYLNLTVPTKAVLPYSDGMTLRAVAGIVGASLGAGLVRASASDRRTGIGQKMETGMSRLRLCLMMCPATCPTGTPLPAAGGSSLL